MTRLVLIAMGVTTLSQPALTQGIKGGGAMGPPAMGPIGPAGGAMAPQVPIFTPPVPVFAPGLGMPQSTPSGTGVPKGSGTTDLIGNGGSGGVGGANPNESRRATAKSNLKQLGVVTVPTADGPWPVPGVNGQFSGGGNLRLLRSDSDGVLKLDIKGPGTYTLTLSAKQLQIGTPISSTSTQDPAGILIGLLLPAVQSAREGIQVHSWSWSQHAFLQYGTNASQQRDLTVVITIPEDEGSPTVNWGDDTPAEIGGIVIPATGDMNFAGGGEARVAVVRNPVSPQANRENGAVSFQDGHAKFASESGVASPSGNPAGPAKLAAILFPVFAQAKLGVVSTGDGTVHTLTTNDQGVALLGKLPLAPLDLNISGENLKALLKTTVSPTNPQPQETLIELLVVIAIIAMKTDGEPIILGPIIVTLSAAALPKNLLLKVSVDSNGVPTALWGNGGNGGNGGLLYGNGGNGGLLIGNGGDGGNGGILIGNGRNGIADSASGTVTPVASDGTKPISDGDANRLKIELHDILVSSLKKGEVGVVTGVFKPEQPLPASTDSKGALVTSKDNNDPRIGQRAMQEACGSDDVEFCANGKHIGNGIITETAPTDGNAR